MSVVFKAKSHAASSSRSPGYFTFFAPPIAFGLTPVMARLPQEGYEFIPRLSGLKIESSVSRHQVSIVLADVRLRVNPVTFARAPAVRATTSN